MSDHTAPYGSYGWKIADLLADADPSIKAIATVRDNGRISITLTEPEAVTLFKLLESKLVEK